MKQNLGLKLSQGLSLTPALQQAIKLLQMSTLDLQQEIQEALDSNMMLEREEGEAGPDFEPERPESATAAEEHGPSEATDNIPEDPPLDYEWSDVFGSGDRENDQALYDFRQANIHTALDLREHLREQAALEHFESGQHLAMEYLIDALDERGFLPDWPDLAPQIASDCNLPLEEVDALRRHLHDWDPSGVGAQDLRECLLIQLAQLPAEPACDLAQALIRDHLETLAQLPKPKLRQKLACDETELDQALGLIRQLNPDPGAAFSPHEQHYVAPDVYVRKQEGRWTASINPGITPKLRINDSYQELVRRADNSPDQLLLKQHLQEARYFLHSLKSRNETLLRVAQEIVDRQRAFLEYGPEAMRPLVLRDIAGQLGIHESTVSRATAHKYMHTPRGLFELKYFFSSAVSTAEGGSCSATAIQAMIRRLVNEESPLKPLSDSRLTQLLIDEGIQVARRTVAKYREGMSIPPSHERKRMA